MVKKKVVVLGGGIVGLSTAYYLIQEGHEVTIIDKGKLDSGASHVNAGYLTPSHIVPMAAPGMISKGIKWMFNAKSPFYIKPRFDLDLINEFFQGFLQSHRLRIYLFFLEENLF